MDNETEVVALPSSRLVKLSQAAYAAYYANFNDDDLFVFDDYVNAGLYLAQIAQFFSVFITLLTGKTDWAAIFLNSFVPAAICMTLWYALRLYRVPGLCFILSLIGNNIFRYFMHYLPLWLICFFILRNWRILLFCVIGDLIARAVSSILYLLFATRKYNDTLARYVSEL